MALFSCLPNCFAVLIVSLTLFKTAFADCYVFECSNNEYCCGYHTCCLNLVSLWYVWFLLILFCCFLFSLIAWCVRWRRQAVIRTNMAAGGRAVVQTATVYPQLHPEMQQPIFYSYGQPAGYGAIGTSQNQYHQPHNYQQSVHSKNPTAPYT